MKTKRKKRPKKPANRDKPVVSLPNRLHRLKDMMKEQKGLSYRDLDEFVPNVTRWFRGGRRLRELIKTEALPPFEREQAGIVLGKLGDPRPGVGLRADGLPDIEWVDLPAGEFNLGETKQGVRIETPFKLSRYPITWAQFQAFVDDPAGYRQERFWNWNKEDRGMLDWWKKNKDNGPANYEPVFQTPNHPRVGVCWYEAAAFCRWLSEKLKGEVRLPHENEWEWAARCVVEKDDNGKVIGGKADNREFPWGTPTQKEKENLDAYLAQRCNCDQTGIGHTSAVGLFPSGQAPCGAMDLSGNVWEWCENWYDEKKKQFRVLRGGAWNDGDPAYLRVAYRSIVRPGIRFDGIGFRCVVVVGSRS